MNLLHKWTIRRLKKALTRFVELIPEHDLERIDSLLETIISVENTKRTAQAAARVLESGKWAVLFFLPNLWFKSTDGLLIITAHEFAHVLLEHDSRFPKEEAEEAVYWQLRTWGIRDREYELFSWLENKHPVIYKFLTSLP